MVQLIRDPDFQTSMNEVELEAWKAFVLVVKNFLGNNKARNYTGLAHQYADCFQISRIKHEHQNAILILTYG